MEITIDRNSWHYRWYRFITDKFRGPDFYWEDPKSLCPYFWGFIFNNLFALFATLLIGTLGTTATVFLSAPVWGGIGMLFMDVGPKIIELMQISAGIWGVFVLVCLIVYLKMSHDIVVTEMTVDKAYNRKPDGFIKVSYSMIGAFKNKVCPRITYKI